MSIEQSDAENFEQLMNKYLQNSNYTPNNYHYTGPLKKLSPLEPLMFPNQNEIPPQNNNIPPQNEIPLQNYDTPINNQIFPPNITNIINNNFNPKNNPPPNNINKINILPERDPKISLREEKKKKQLEYQLILEEQIKEKKLREKQEKEKQLKEDLLYEEKIKQEQEKLLLEQKEKKLKKQNIFEQSPLTEEQIENKENPENIELLESVEKPSLKRTKSQQYLQNINQNQLLTIENNGSSKKIPAIINQNLVSVPIEHLVSSSTQIPQPLSQQQILLNQQKYKTQSGYYPNYKQRNNNNQLLQQQFSNNNNFQNQRQEKINPYMSHAQYYPNIPTSSITNMSINPTSNMGTCYQIPFNKLNKSNPNIVNSSQGNFMGYNVLPPSNSQNFNDLVNMNINNQNYFGKIMEMFFHEQEKIIESYKETIEKLKTERDEAIYKNKTNEEKIIALQKIQNDQELLTKNLGYYPFKKEYNQNLEKTLDSMLMKNNNNNNDIDLNFNDLYIKEEINNNNQNNIVNNSIISESKPSLLCSTKLVKQTGNKKLLETWNKDDYPGNDENNNKIIQNNNQINIVNPMDTNTVMAKINQINSKILDPPDEQPVYYLNGDISAFSKKDNENSYTKEINNEDEFHIENNKNKNNSNLEQNITKSSNDNKNSEKKNNDIILNNVNNIIMENLDNNVSYSTQIRERELNKKKINQNITVDKVNFDEVNLTTNNNNTINNNNQNNDTVFIAKKNIDNNLSITQKTKNNNTNLLEEDELPNLDSPKGEPKSPIIFNTNKKSENQIQENNTIKKSDIKSNIKTSEFSGKKDTDNTIINKMNFFDGDNTIQITKKEKPIQKLSSHVDISEVDDSLLRIDGYDNNIKININESSTSSKNNKEHNVSIRPPMDLNVDKINSLNNLYGEFMKKKQEKLNETNKSIMSNSKNIKNVENENNVLENNSMLYESLNTFTHNLNVKWKDMSKLNNDEEENNFNNKNNASDSNMINNNNVSYSKDKDESFFWERDRKDDEKIFDKVNQLTKVALNELEQSQLSVFSKDKNNKKHY